MITIFCDFFLQFSAKRLAVFSKTNVMIKFLKKLPFVLSQKCQFFRRFFWRKYFLKIITSVPGHPVPQISSEMNRCRPQRSGAPISAVLMYSLEKWRKIEFQISSCNYSFRILNEIVFWISILSLQTSSLDHCLVSEKKWWRLIHFFQMTVVIIEKRDKIFPRYVSYLNVIT
jgi:hypothetical protein